MFFWGGPVTPRNTRWFGSLREDDNLYGTISRSSMSLLVGGFNPFEKYESNFIISPRIGMKIKNIWNHLGLGCLHSCCWELRVRGGILRRNRLGESVTSVTIGNPTWGFQTPSWLWNHVLGNAAIVTFLGWWSDPSKRRIVTLQLRNQKGALNHLAGAFSFVRTDMKIVLSTTFGWHLWMFVLQ